MSLYNGPPRPGARGGRGEFSWESVKADKDREYYLGHSVKALTGRWQKGKDVYWYTRDKGAGDVVRDEIEAVKQREKELMDEALGLKPKRAKTITAPSLDKQDMDKLFNKRDEEGDEQDPDRIKGLGFATGGVGPSGEVRETLQGTGIKPDVPPFAAAPGGPRAGGELLSLEQLQKLAEKDEKKTRKKDKKDKKTKKTKEEKKGKKEKSHKHSKKRRKESHEEDRHHGSKARKRARHDSETSSGSSSGASSSSGDEAGHRHKRRRDDALGAAAGSPVKQLRDEDWPTREEQHRSKDRHGDDDSRRKGREQEQRHAEGERHHERERSRPGFDRGDDRSQRLPRSYREHDVGGSRDGERKHGDSRSRGHEREHWGQHDERHRTGGRREEEQGWAGASGGSGPYRRPHGNDDEHRKQDRKQDRGR